VDGARRIARLCRENGVQRLIHVSAMNANVDSPSAYLRSKAMGEHAVQEEFKDAIIVRPSLLFGLEDRFFNRLWYLRTFFRGIPIVEGGNAIVRPLDVSDAASALAQLLRMENVEGKVVELFGYLLTLILICLDQKNIINMTLLSSSVILLRLDTHHILSPLLFIRHWLK
jgi:NADH dehydrogenase (ubiquinone) 1 alpha subcomplex subunit 9